MLFDLSLAIVVLASAQTLLVAGVMAVRPRGNVYVTIIAVACLTTPAAVMADSWLFGRALAADGRLFLGLTNLALGGFLFHFMTLPDRSVTLRILVELDLAPARTLSVSALNERYSVRAMIGSRLDQLADGGFITIAPGGALTLEPRGRLFGRFVTGGRRLFRIDSAN